MSRYRPAPQASWLFLPAGLVLRLLFVMVACGLCLLWLPTPLGKLIGCLLTLASPFVPRAPLPWVLILILGATVVASTPQGPSWRFAAVLAGVHLLHIFASFMLVLPERARVQMATFLPTAIRFVIIQVLAQTLSFVLLSLASRYSPVASPLAVAVGGLLVVVALIGLSLVALPPLIRYRKGPTTHDSQVIAQTRNRPGT